MASVGFCRALSETSRDWLNDCRRAERRGASSILSADVPGRDGFVDAALAAAATDRVPLSIGVALPTRSPLQTALAAASIAGLGRVFTLGLGIGTPITNQVAHGVGYHPSLGRLRDFTECVLAVLRGPSGVPVELVTDRYRVASGGLGLEREQVPVVIGAQGPRTIRWAAEATDGIILHLMTSRRALAQRKSMVSDARGVDPRFHLSAGMVVSVHAEEKEALRRARADLTVAMSRPWYAGRLTDAVGPDLRDKFARLVDDERWGDAARLLPEHLVRDFILVSTPDRVLDDLEELEIVNEVVPVGCGNFYSQRPEAFGLTAEDARQARTELRQAILGDPRR